MRRLRAGQTPELAKVTLLLAQPVVLVPRAINEGVEK